MLKKQQYRKKIAQLIKNEHYSLIEPLLEEIREYSQSNHDKCNDFADFFNEAIKKDNRKLIDIFNGYTDLFEKQRQNHIRNIKDKYTHPICVAIDSNNFYALDKIISSISDINLTIGIKENFLHYAVRKKNLIAVQKLLKTGIQIDKLNYSGDTPLYIACEKNLYDISQHLILNGAQLNLQNHSRETALVKAIEGKSQNIFELIFSQSNFKDDIVDENRNRKMLYYAIRSQNNFAINYLLDVSDLQHEDKFTPYMTYFSECQIKYNNVIKYLKKEGKCLPDIYKTSEYSDKDRYEYFLSTLNNFSKYMPVAQLDKVTMLYLDNNRSLFLNNQNYSPIISDFLTENRLEGSLYYFIKNVKSIKDSFSRNDNLPDIITFISSLSDTNPNKEKLDKLLWQRFSKIKDKTFLDDISSEHLKYITGIWITRKEHDILKVSLSTNVLNRHFSKSRL